MGRISVAFILLILPLVLACTALFTGSVFISNSEHLSRHFGPWAPLLTAHVLLGYHALATCFVRLRMNVNDRDALLNFIFRYGLFYAIFMLIINGQVSFEARMVALSCGALFGLVLCLIFAKQIGSQHKHKASDYEIYNLNLPVSHNRLGNFVYYCLPAIALLLIFTGPIAPIQESRDGWLRALIFTAGMTCYYPFCPNRFDNLGKYIIANWPIIFGVIFLISSKSA